MSSPLSDSSCIYLNDTISPQKSVGNEENTAEKDVDTQEKDLFISDDEGGDLETGSKSSLKINTTKESPGLDSTKDIFDTSQESEGSVLCLESPKKAKKVSPKKSPARSHKAQLSIESFLMQKSSSNTSRRRRVQQSKMDLFVKWKDPAREKQSDNARREFFAGPSKRKEAHKSSDEEPEVISSPPKKRSSQDSRAENPSSKSSSALKQSPAKKKSSQKTFSIMEENERQMKERRRIMKGLLDESFEKSHHNANLDKVKKEQAGKLKEGMVVRQKADRERMHAADCACCKDYYDALDLSPESKQKRIQQVGRHRYVEQPKPKTPEHYWEVGFPSESEQKRRGYIRVKSPKKKLAAKNLFTSP